MELYPITQSADGTYKVGSTPIISVEFDKNNPNLSKEIVVKYDLNEDESFKEFLSEYAKAKDSKCNLEKLERPIFPDVEQFWDNGKQLLYTIGKSKIDKSIIR